MTTLALVVYGVALAVAGVAVWRRPVVALYAFIVGLALHNATMDALYAAGVRGHSLTAIQAWKDVLLLVALARVAFDAARARRLPFKPELPDALALAFGAIVVLYALIPQHALDGHATHRAVAYALRHDLTGVGAYFLGRAVVPRMRDVRWLILGVAAAVAAWGLIDVYAIDLDWWRRNGTVGYFRDQLKYPYGPGLSHLPENFVYNTGNEHELTRRLVSTLLSPLGAAYLCAVALLLAPRTRAAVPLAVVAAVGLLWTHTRAAVVGLAVGFVVLAAVCRRPWPLVAGAATLVAGFVLLAVFPRHRPEGAFHARRAHVPARPRERDRPDDARAVDRVPPRQPAGRPHDRRPPPAGLRARQRGRGRRSARACRSRPASRTTRSSASRRGSSARSSSSRGTSRCSSTSRDGARERLPQRSQRCCSWRSRPTRTASRGSPAASGGSPAPGSPAPRRSRRARRNASSNV